VVKAKPKDVCLFLVRYITEEDLEFFRERVEKPGDVKGAGPWEHMVSKDFGSFTYEAWRRSIAVRLYTASSCSCSHITAACWCPACVSTAIVSGQGGTLARRNITGN
jgi:hypothetical protein